GIAVSDLRREATDHHVRNSAIGVANVDVGNSQAGGSVMGAVIVIDGEPVAYHSKMELIYLRRADYFRKVAGDRPVALLAGPAAGDVLADIDLVRILAHRQN